MDIKKKTVFYDKLTFIYLEMPKFNKSIDQLESRFEKWMYVLKNLSKLQELPSKLQERIFEKMFNVAEIAKMNIVEYREYEDSLKVYRDWYSVLKTAKREAGEKGIEEGRAKGRAEGIEEGRAEGKIEEKIEIAQRLLNKGMSKVDVSDATGLSEEQIKALIKS
jgi:predicted transposase/invertase (TIGR01784 family)